MKQKSILKTGACIVSLVATVASGVMLNDARFSKASVIKNCNTAQTESALPDVEYNGEKMYVAKASFYDVYSDSEVGTGSTPLTIDHAVDGSKACFSKFNLRMKEIMNYENASMAPSKYPLYQGRQGKVYGYIPSYWAKDLLTSTATAYATQGLVDSKLSYDSNGESYITQSNPSNGKSSKLPHFDKKFLTENKHTNSQLSLGSVRENVAFPFRREIENGVTYYEYNTSVDTIRFNSNNQLNYLGKNNTAEMVTDLLGQGGLFPDNVKAESNSNKLNYAFGVKIEVPFNSTRDGKIDGKDMIFQFTGDDDVWVFIDGILALDLGGAHPKISGSINFAKQEATASAVDNLVAYQSGTASSHAYQQNCITPFSTELKNKLADTSKVHTLTLFYMERGMEVANMMMKFNLPEPTKLDVSNTIKYDNVGTVFKEETKKVANKDSFVYDVVDKTTNKKAEVDMIHGDIVTFLNEFAEKDILLVQQKGLKTSSRKLTSLYTTKWTLSDSKGEISKGDGLVVDDSRTSDKTIVMKNSDDVGVPVLDVDYINNPTVGEFKVVCKATDKLKQENANYKDKEFTYIISYKEVFGGTSKEVVYNGAYKVLTENGETLEKTTENGKIVLKSGETMIIEGVPLQTQMKVKAELGENDSIGKVVIGSDFKYTKSTKTIEGKIKFSANNIVEIQMGAKSEETKEEIIEDAIEEEPTLEIEDTATDDELDDTVSTGDESNVNILMMICMASIFVFIVSSKLFIKSRR